MANHPAASPVPPLLTPEEPDSFTITINPSYQAPVHTPTAVFSISHRRKLFYMRPVPEGTHVEQATFLTPPKCFHLPLSILSDRSRWQHAASWMLHYFSFRSEVYAQLLSHLYTLGADWSEIALRHGCTKWDVAVDVHESIEIDFPPLFPVDPESMPPLEEASIGQNMKLKELSEIAAGETCAVCFEEFGGSTNAATETPCSHLFHIACLLPWLSRATTCPLCRSSLRIPRSKLKVH